MKILKLDFDSQSPKIGISIAEIRIKCGFKFEFVNHNATFNYFPAKVA